MVQRQEDDAPELTLGFDQTRAANDARTCGEACGSYVDKGSYGNDGRDDCILGYFPLHWNRANRGRGADSGRYRRVWRCGAWQIDEELLVAINARTDLELNQAVKHFASAVSMAGGGNSYGGSAAPTTADLQASLRSTALSRTGREGDSADTGGEIAVYERAIPE